MRYLSRVVPWGQSVGADDTNEYVKAEESMVDYFFGIQGYFLPKNNE